MLLNFILFRMDFDDLGALSPFVTPKTKCVLHPPTLEVSSPTLVTPSTASSSLQSNPYRVWGEGGLAGFARETKSSTTASVALGSRIAVIGHSSATQWCGSTVFSLIRVPKPKLQIELGGVAVLL
jgi:hypothetical protein